MRDRQGTCKHFNGSHHNTHCEAGMCYDQITPNASDPGSYYRMPCHRVFPDMKRAAEVWAEHGTQGTCEKYEEPTSEDIAADDAAMEAAIARMKRTLPLCVRIKVEHEGENWKGVETCPECGGKLHLSHAACNGHVWGKCETEDCLAWME